MDILSYRDHDAVIVEVFDVIDIGDQDSAREALCAEIDQCVSPTMIVRLCDPLVTVAALHVLADTQHYAHRRGIILHAVVDPSAEHILRIAGLDYLLRAEFR